MPSVRAEDRVQRVALLGMRFWDSATARPVTDGLNVVVSDPRRAAASVATIVSPSGTHVLHTFPGLGALTRSAGDEAYWNAIGAAAHASPPGLPTLRVRVDDAAGRFLPTRFDVTVPHRGLLGLGASMVSPPQPAYVVLYSGASRPVPGSMAVLRAQLYDDARARFAAWAMLAVSYEGMELARGLANEQGTIALFFAYPEFPRIGASPPAAPPLVWNIDLRASCAGFVADEVPDLNAIHVQPRVRIAFDASPPGETAPIDIAFGSERVVHTPGSPFLHLTPL